MMKFCALNESSLSDDDGDPELASREAQEEESFGLYTAALKLQSERNFEESEEMFKELLEMEFITKARPHKEKDKSPALNLKYLIYKNLAAIANDRQDYNSSVEFYLEALNMDATDVNMWYRMGQTSLNIPNYALSRLSFEEGLKCNPNHWPCLDSVITVMYTLNDYSNCLYYISKALERECYYLKGLSLKDEIYNEDPSLKSFCEGYFKRCNPSINCTDYDKSEAKKFLEECLEMRKKKRALYKTAPLPVLTLKNSIKEFSWKNLGESFVHMYDFISSAEPKISYSCKIDLTQYLEGNNKGAAIECDKQLSPSPASSLSDPCSPASPSCHPNSLNSQPHGGLLQIALHPNGDSHKQAQTPATSNQMEIEIDDSPIVCNINGLPSSSYTIMLPRIDIQSPDLSMYNDSATSSKRAKRKRLLSELSDFVSKRRSTRVRNTTSVKKPQDNVNYQELLQKFLPPRLIGDGKFDEQDDDSDPISEDKLTSDHTYGQSLDSEKKDAKDQLCSDNLSSSEKEDVQEFITKCLSNSGIIDLLYKYIMHLGSKSNLVWPKCLLDVYCNCFVRLRNHVNTPSLFCHETEKHLIKEMGMAVLLYSEFKVDHWYLTTGHTMSFSPKIPSSDFQNNQYSVGRDFHADMEFLVQLTGRSDVLEDDWFKFTVRALWLKAKFHSLEGEIDLAVYSMEKLSIVFSCEDAPATEVKVENCNFSDIVTADNVQRQLESLQRCQSLEEVQRLYEHGDYTAVVDLLILTFSQPRAKRKQNLDGVPERHAQLILLQNSLWNLKRYKDCVYWSEVSFNEALQQFMNAARSDWSETMAHLLSVLDKCAKINKKYLSELEESKLVRLTQNLILVIVIQMENYDFASDSPLLVVLPWILLYRLILNEELKAKETTAKKSKQSTSGKPSVNENSAGETSDKAGVSSFLIDFDLSAAMPSSLMLLFTAHEYLGRRSWCATSEGVLLLHCIDVMMRKLEDKTGNVHLYREDLETGLEQCFYCLYGHPNKRTRAKHLQEHNSSQISLTWARAGELFKYFKPDILPEFDSYRTSTVSAELEYLLKRISSIVPTEEDPTNRVDSYSAYIEGGTDKCPDPPPANKPPSEIVKDLYYLLGDYYFKNKEFSKAIRFYLLDICINPNRLDSWAGMALSRSSQLDQKLNSYELRNEATIYRKSSAALKCFEHALELDPTTISLWIEYGSLAYILHSHASRQLKQDSFCDGLYDLLKKKKLEMLEVAERCFRAANHCDEGGEPEEAWLHHYMLGKISEKKDENPRVYLDHYKKALMYLHQDEARYPTKIQYHNPLELAIEALEVYYRVHASCLKFLWKHESKGVDLETLKNMQTCIAEVATSPFALFQEKCKKEREISPSSVSASEEEYVVQLPESVDPENKLEADHNYCDSVQDAAKKFIDESDGRINLPSTESSSESEDSAIVKEIMNSLISVVSEQLNDERSEIYDGPILIVGDKKIPKVYRDNLYDAEVDTDEADTPSAVDSLLEDEEMDTGDISALGSKEKDNLSKLEQLALQLETHVISHQSGINNDSNSYFSIVEQISNSGDGNLVIDEDKMDEINKSEDISVMSVETSDALKGQETPSILNELDVAAMALDDILAELGKLQSSEEVILLDESEDCVEMESEDGAFSKDVKENENDAEVNVTNAIDENIQVKDDTVEELTKETSKDLTTNATCLVSVPLSKLDNWPNKDIVKPNLNGTDKCLDQDSNKNNGNQSISQKKKRKHNSLSTTSQSDSKFNSQPKSQKEDSSEGEKNPKSDDSMLQLENDVPLTDKSSISKVTEKNVLPEEDKEILCNEPEVGSSKELSEKTDPNLNKISKNTENEELMIIEPQPIVIPPPTPEELKKSKSEILKLIPQSLDAMRECLQRFIQHYKALYRIAHYYCHSTKNKNLQYAREILLAATPPVKGFPSMPGLFADRKNTNFFNGIWRAPSNEIDRPGSFGAHMSRSVHLLIEVLSQQKDYNMLLNLTQQLYRTPDLGKKYMRDTDRVNLVREAYDSCVSILRDQMNSLLQEEPPPEESRLTCCLLEIYRSCQTLLKAGIYVDETNELLEEAYTMYRIGEVDPHPSVLEQAIKFCQLQLGKSYQSIHEGSKYNSSKYLLSSGEPSDSGTNVLPSVNSFTPDVWQKEYTKSLMLPTLPCEARNKQETPTMPEPLIVIPFEGKFKTHLGKQPSTSHSANSSKMVHVEKPKAENLQACSVAFLPMTPVFSADNQNSTQLQKTATLLSCQAFECFDVLTTIMQASGYKVAPQANDIVVSAHSQSSSLIRDGPNSCKSANIIQPQNWKIASERPKRGRSTHKYVPFTKREGLDLSKRSLTKPIVNCTIANEIIDLKVNVSGSRTKTKNSVNENALNKSKKMIAKCDSADIVGKKLLSQGETAEKKLESFDIPFNEVLNLTVRSSTEAEIQSTTSNEIKRKIEKPSNSDLCDLSDAPELSPPKRHKRRKISAQVLECKDLLTKNNSLDVLDDAETDLLMEVDQEQKQPTFSLHKESSGGKGLDLIQMALKEAGVNSSSLENIAESSNSIENATNFEQVNLHYGDLDLSKDSATEFAINSPKSTELSEENENSSSLAETLEKIVSSITKISEDFSNAESDDNDNSNSADEENWTAKVDGKRNDASGTFDKKSGDIKIIDKVNDTNAGNECSDSKNGNPFESIASKSSGSDVPKIVENCNEQQFLKSKGEENVHNRVDLDERVVSEALESNKTGVIETDNMSNTSETEKDDSNNDTETGSNASSTSTKEGSQDVIINSDVSDEMGTTKTALEVSNNEEDTVKFIAEGESGIKNEDKDIVGDGKENDDMKIINMEINVQDGVENIVKIYGSENANIETLDQDQNKKIEKTCEINIKSKDAVNHIEVVIQMMEDLKNLVVAREENRI